jgi:dTDP-glucose pyrophosphorylase
MPKHEIIVRGRSLFEWSVISLQNFFSEKFIFVGRKSNWNKKNLSLDCRRLGIKHFEFIELAVSTMGQADTVNQALKQIGGDGESLMVYNIDTYVQPEALVSGDIKGEGWIPVFEAEGDRWSFCVLNQDGLVTEVAEKRRISNLATVGLYYFKTGAIFRECYQKYDFSQYPEQFVAPLYNILISDDRSQVFATTLPSAAVHVLGTPEDIRQFAPEFC